MDMQCVNRQNKGKIYFFSDKKIHGHAHELKILLLLRFPSRKLHENEHQNGARKYAQLNTQTELWSRNKRARFAQGWRKSHFVQKNLAQPPHVIAGFFFPIT